MDMLYSKILRCIKIRKMKITEINASKIIFHFYKIEILWKIDLQLYFYKHKKSGT